MYHLRRDPYVSTASTSTTVLLGNTDDLGNMVKNGQQESRSDAWHHNTLGRARWPSLTLSHPYKKGLPAQSTR